MRTLLIGGARSGKSSLAARWAGERSNDVCCIVTATASDGEMSTRIALHRQERPQHWRVREEPIRLGTALREESRTSTLSLVDCLTLWTANCLWPPHAVAAVPTRVATPIPAAPDPCAHSAAAPGANTNADLPPDIATWHSQRTDFLSALHDATHDVIIVSNEVGTGLVSEYAAARLFRDEHGRLNQLVAAACDEVFLVTAGLALRLK